MDLDYTRTNKTISITLTQIKLNQEYDVIFHVTGKQISNLYLTKIIINYYSQLSFKAEDTKKNIKTCLLTALVEVQKT